MGALTPFHIAFPVDDLAKAREFYGKLLGCPEGRSSDQWIDFDLFGHQIVAHLKPRADTNRDGLYHNPVDGHDVPVPHFGVVLTMDAFKKLADRLTAVQMNFVIKPSVIPSFFKRVSNANDRLSISETGTIETFSRRSCH